jgi:hypothetical protein
MNVSEKVTREKRFEVERTWADGSKGGRAMGHTSFRLPDKAITSMRYAMGMTWSGKWEDVNANSYYLAYSGFVQSDEEAKAGAEEGTPTAFYVECECSATVKDCPRNLASDITMERFGMTTFTMYGGRSSTRGARTSAAAPAPVGRLEEVAPLYTGEL